MRLPPGKEGCLLMQRFSLTIFRLAVPQIRGHTNTSQSSSSRHFSTWSKEIVWIRPLCLNNCKETSNEDRTKTFWLNESKCEGLVATATSLSDPERWADGFYMCGSHCEAWRWRCDAVGAGWHLSRTITWSSNATVIPNMPPGHGRAIWAGRRVMGCRVTWPGTYGNLTQTQGRGQTAKCWVPLGTTSGMLDDHLREKASSVQSN